MKYFEENITFTVLPKTRKSKQIGTLARKSNVGDKKSGLISVFGIESREL